MKNQIFYFILITLLASCTKNTVTEPPLIVSIVVDKTDTNFLAHPHAAEVLKVIDLTHHTNAKAIFRYSEITDLSLSPVLEYILPNDSVTEGLNTMDDVEFRHKKVIAFSSKVDSIIQAAGTPRAMPTRASQCYVAIAKEIEYLWQHNLQPSTVLVYSDLCELGNGVNVYSSTNFDSYHRNEIERQLLQIYPLPNPLSDIKVKLIYQPRDQLDDARFAFMAKIYRDLLESRGATVSISTDDHSIANNE